MIDKEDLELKLFAGVPIKVEPDVWIYAHTIKDISNLGLKKYNEYLSIVTINKKGLIQNQTILDNIKDIGTYELIVFLCVEDSSFKERMLEALKFFLMEEVYLDKYYGFYLQRNNELLGITSSMYDEIVSIIKLQNRLGRIDDYYDEIAEDVSPKVREILEKRKAAREKLRRAKMNASDDDEIISFTGMISSLCARGNGINPFNIWDIPIYTFYDQLDKMKCIEEYKIGIDSLLAGAKAEDVELRHWMLGKKQEE